jgi:hypothetical protein
MFESKKINELEAMIVILAQRIEKLEGKTRLAPYSSYLNDLRNEAIKMLKFWN